jgi:hypothetical protein
LPNYPRRILDYPAPKSYGQWILDFRFGIWDLGLSVVDYRVQTIAQYSMAIEKMNKQAIILNFLEHLQVQREALIIKNNTQPPIWGDETLHDEVYNHNFALYALLSLVETTQPSQRLHILFQILQTSRSRMHDDIRNILERITKLLLTTLHPEDVIKVFLALRRVRANHKHVTRAILNYIFLHPNAVEMAISRRPAIVDCLEHALGKNVARSCAKIALTGGDGIYLRHNLLRFVNHAERVKCILQLLYRQEKPQIGSNEYRLAHQKYAQILKSRYERPKTVTATNRGDIAATLVHLYRGGKSDELITATEEYVKTAVINLPRFDGTIALVFDASASTRSYGDREYCCLAQSVALKLVLEQCCSKLKIYQVGGSGDKFPVPVGETDLATALLDALKNQPDIVAIVSDGYENLYPGDLQRVIATLPQIGITTPVVFCHSKFTNLDDLELRRPINNTTQIEFWHEADFENLMLSLFAQAGEIGEASLMKYLLQKLKQIEIAMMEP